MPTELARAYDPTEVESRIYRLWEERGCFAAPADSPKPPFSITIPPPNVTGELHMGHALQHAIHDLLLRRKRMQGFNALCLPGTDHAGIGTQMKVEQALRREGTSGAEIGREAFVARAREWTLTYGGAILGQLRALGCSYDWSRLRFTLDEFVEAGPETADWALGRLYTRGGYARAVLTAFVEFHRRGWIYRGERIVNWCPECRTVVSDLEVQHQDLASHLWHIRYPAADGGEGLVVATTRPETMLGDTGVAVNPGDARYAGLVGKMLRLPLLDREIPVVADHHVDPEFGSGAVKVTPAHDPSDWDIAQRHPALLPAIGVMDDVGVMTAPAGPYAGLPRAEARARVVEDLKGLGLLVETEAYSHSVGHHDRCGTVIEPLLKLQWWARCRELADLALAAIRAGRVRFTPERFRQMEVDWLENIRDWCVSRQLWWGHRIPLWYCLDCDPEARLEDGRLLAGADARPQASVDRPTACAACGGGRLEQDPDVMDTWFSSALWPHGTLGWPEETTDLAAFYPTDVMITGRDILYLWVARMVMTGEAFLGREPFRQVIVHATVLTEDGKRMSKSLGTGVDPLELIRLYGADATRFGLASLVTESQDIRFKIQWESGGKVAAGPEDRLARAEQIEQSRNFCTKLWNISRFVLLNVGEGAFPSLEDLAARAEPSPHLADRWVLSRLAATGEAVNAAIERCDLGEAAWTLYHFAWDDLADWYVELAKPRFREGDPTVREVILTVLEATLRLAHPFMPFVTEEIWQSLPGRGGGETLATAAYPGAIPALRDPAAEAAMEAVIEVTRAIRNLKAEVGQPQKHLEVRIAGGAGLERSYVELAARVTLVDGLPDGPAARASAAGTELAIALAGLVDPAAEIARLEREIAGLEKEAAGVRARLDNPQFVQRAPAEVVEKQQAQLHDLTDRLTATRERLGSLKA